MTKTVRISNESFRILRDHALKFGSSVADVLDSILESFFEVDDLEEIEEIEVEEEEE